MVRALLAVAALFALSACAAQTDDQVSEQALAEDGRAIAEAQCAGCHAVGEYGESPNAAAPPLRTVLAQHSGDVLAEELIQGIQVAHPMPDLQLNPQGVDALLAYLRSIQQPPAATN